MVKEKEPIFDLEGEEWRSVGVIKGIDFTGCYEVSNKGRFRSLDRVITYKSGFDREYKGQLLKLFKDSQGYLTAYLRLNENNVTILAHRVVALRFIPNPDPEHKTQVNHKDENKENNCIENLEWVTNDENAVWGTKTDRVMKSEGTSVVQMDLDGNLIRIFPSIRCANRETKMCVSNAIKNQTHIIREYFWITESEYNSLSKEKLIQKIEIAMYNKKNRIKPDCTKRKEEKAKRNKIVKLSKDMEYIAVYDSTSLAANDNGITARNIRDCLRGIHKTSGGFVWMRLYDYENLNK